MRRRVPNAEDTLSALLPYDLKSESLSSLSRRVRLMTIFFSESVLSAFTKVLRDLGLVKIDEPFQRLLTQGMVLKDGAKMAKSKGNVVDPEYMIEAYGTDTTRLFLLFAAPPEKDLEWSDQGVAGSNRFLHRLWNLVQALLPEIATVRAYQGKGEDLEPAIWDFRHKLHKAIKKVTDDIEDSFHFNTAIAAIMELVNDLYGAEEAIATPTARSSSTSQAAAG